MEPIGIWQFICKPSGGLAMLKDPGSDTSFFFCDLESACGMGLPAHLIGRF